jgi:hypothetical protein
MTLPPTQTPGWYPDPWGEGAQRYFDGLNWGPAASVPGAPPPQPPPPLHQPAGKPSKKNLLWLSLCFVGFFALISTCDTDDKKSDSSPSRTSSAAATTTAETSIPNISSSVQAAPPASPTPTGPIKPDATFTTGEGPNGQEVTATFSISDNLTEGFIKSGARGDTIEILKYAVATYPNAAQVTVVGSFPMEDAYGNTETDEVVNITYLRSTLEKINFDGVDRDKIWELRDSGYIAPAFQP